jgi:RNA polymerase-interacting CarD/CdnL/TRCF family regulator
MKPNGSFTDHGSYGKNKAYNAYLQSSNSSNVINHVMNHGQNQQNLASNPNQKRIVSNASNMMFGNLAVASNMTKTQTK